MDPVSGADDPPSGTAADGSASSPAGPPATEPIEPGSLGAHPERHPDDLPPPERSGRRIPSGVLWALALAVVLLTIASWVAFSTDGDKAADPDVVRLDDPSLPVSPTLGEVTDMTGQPVSTLEYSRFDGSATNLAAQAGKPMVINFWASFCAPCVEEMPAFEAVHQDLGDQVEFVGLAVSDGESAARGLAERTGVSYDLGFDPTGQILLGSGGVVLPTTVFVGADGTILETHHKVLDEAGLRERIDQHFGIAGTS